MQNDVNLTTGPLSGSCGTDSVPQADGTTVTYTSHFTNKAVQHRQVHQGRPTPPARRIDNLFGFPNGVLKGQGTPGGCTRDLVHKFYQEQYQLNGGQQNRYVTGSDAVGLTMGYYDTTDLPIYRYLHGKKAPALRHRRPLLPGGVRWVVPQPPVPRRRPAAAVVADGSGERSTASSTAPGMPRNNYPLYTHDVPGAGQRR